MVIDKFQQSNKQKTTRKTNTFGTHPKSNRKIEERDEIDTLNTQIHDRSFSCLGTGISIKIGEGKLILHDILYVQTASYPRSYRNSIHIYL
jgi:hypothetical protein